MKGASCVLLLNRPSERANDAESRLRSLAEDLTRAVELSSRCVQYARQAESHPHAVAQFDHVQSKIRPILRRLPPLNLMAQQGIRVAIAEAKQAQNIQQTMQANRNLYAVIHEACSHLYAELPPAFQVR